jgi:hypothetical protein
MSPILLWHWQAIIPAIQKRHRRESKRIMPCLMVVYVAAYLTLMFW